MKRYVTIGESQEKLNTNAPHTRGKHKATERAAEKAQATAAQELAKTDSKQERPTLGRLF